MDAATALRLVNQELARYGRAPLEISEQESQRAFHSLRLYAAAAGRPLDDAIRAMVRFQIQGEKLQRSN